jgi:hypothetical protein
VIAASNLIHPITRPTGLAVILAWPALIHPAWVGLVVAILVTGGVVQLWDRQAKRDAARALAAASYARIAAATKLADENPGTIILPSHVDAYLANPETGAARTRPDRPQP